MGRKRAASGKPRPSSVKSSKYDSDSTVSISSDSTEHSEVQLQNSSEMELDTTTKGSISDSEGFLFAWEDSDSSDLRQGSDNPPRKTSMPENDMPSSPSPTEKGNFTTLRRIHDIPTSQWNNCNAHIVLGAFRVKRYQIDPDYIFCPNPSGPHDELRVSRILKSEKSWKEVYRKIDWISNVFEGDTDLITNLHKEKDVFRKVKNSLSHNIRASLSQSKDPKKRSGDFEFINYEHQWINRLQNLFAGIETLVTRKETLPGSCYTEYMDLLIDIFGKISGFHQKITLKQNVFLPHFNLEIPSLNKNVRKPRPDFFLRDNMTDQVLGVGEVKCPLSQGFSFHRGTRVPSRKPTQDNKLVNPSDAVQIDAIEDRLPNADEEQDRDTQEGVESKEDERSKDIDEESGESEENDTENDDYDQQESLIEVSEEHLLPAHLSYLDLKQKKQLRCVLPQIFGQMLALTSLEPKPGYIQVFDLPYASYKFGICLVGMKARFVAMVLKDTRRDFIKPSALHLEKSQSVRPYIYVTSELNLFKKRHVCLFMQTLFALCCVS